MNISLTNTDPLFATGESGLRPPAKRASDA
jgi:hypothetical protein